MPMQQLALFFLAAAAVGGVAWVFLYPLLSGERARRAAHAERRASPTASAPRSSARAAPKVRREQLEETLKELEARSKKRKKPAAGGAHRAGRAEPGRSSSS